MTTCLIKNNIRKNPHCNLDSTSENNERMENNEHYYVRSSILDPIDTRHHDNELMKFHCSGCSQQTWHQATGQ